MESLHKEAEESLKDLHHDIGNETKGNISITSEKGNAALKSGKEAKTTDNVKVALKWPHKFVKYNVGQQQMSYNSLDFTLLVAGGSLHNKC